MKTEPVTGIETGTADLKEQSLTLITQTPGETFDLGRKVGEALCRGDVVALSGELGAGKTCLAQGIARGLAVSERYEITSPTFTLVNEYPGRIALYHLDLYRLAGIGELQDIGCEEIFLGGGVVVVEWAEKIRESLPPGTLWMFMDYCGESERRIRIAGSGDRAEQLIGALRKGGM